MPAYVVHGGMLLLSLVPNAFACPREVPAPWDADVRADAPRLLVVFKRAFELGLYEAGRLVDGQCYPIAMGATPEGPKTRMDRSSTLEGWYRVAERRDEGQTAYHRAFLVDYPNGDDADRALAAGVIDGSTHARLRASSEAGRLPSQTTAMGGWILIHGMGSTPRDWTWGCVGVDNPTIDALFPRVQTGDPILFVPWAPSH